MTALSNRLAKAWRKREGPALKLLTVMGLLTASTATAHVSRGGTLTARIGAACLLLGTLAAILFLARYQRRGWESERGILRRVLWPVDRRLAQQALRAVGLVERTVSDEHAGSTELARHHYEKLLRKASVDAVKKQASRRATAWRWATLALVLAILAGVLPDPMRVLEGFDVLLASKGKAPVPFIQLDLPRVVVRPPSYLRLADRAARFGASHELATGSTIQVQGVARYPGRSLVLTDGEREVPFISNGRGGLTASWSLRKSADLRVASRFGDVVIEEPESLSAEALPDTTPVVVVEGAPKKVSMQDFDHLDIRYFVTDDHGVRQVDLVIASGKRETRKVLQQLSGDSRVARGGYTLDSGDELLRRMFLPVSVVVEGKDDDPIAGPKWGRSEAITILPPPVGKPEAMRYTALSEAASRFTDLLAIYHETEANRGERRERIQVARKAAIDHMNESLDKSYAGLEVPNGMTNFLKGQLRVLGRAPKPGVSRKRQLEDAILAMDAALARLSAVEARSVSVLLADVVEEIAEGAHQAREAETKKRGHERAVHALELARDGAAELVKLGVLGGDLGSVAEGDLARVGRALEHDDLVHTELAARHLAARLRRPNPSFGSASRGGVESGASSGARQRDEKASQSDEQFDQLAQELEQLARDHARGIVSAEHSLNEARESANMDALAEEAKRRARAVRESVADLPQVGADPGTASAAAALAREHAQAMAQNLERLDLGEAVRSGHEALDALQETQRRIEGGSEYWRGREELQEAKARLETELKWAKQKLDKLEREATQKARQALGEVSQKERELAKRAGNLAGRGKNDQSPLPEDLLRRLERAETLMRQAADELAEGRAEDGLDLQKDAQRLLEQSRSGKTTDRNNPGERDTGDHGGKNLSTAGEVPDPDEKDKTKDFRKRVLEGLGREGTGRLSPAIKRYAEELLR